MNLRKWVSEMRDMWDYLRRGRFVHRQVIADKTAEAEKATQDAVRSAVHVVEMSHTVRTNAAFIREVLKGQ